MRRSLPAAKIRQNLVCLCAPLGCPPCLLCPGQGHTQPCLSCTAQPSVLAGLLRSASLSAVFGLISFFLATFQYISRMPQTSKCFRLCLDLALLLNSPFLKESQNYYYFGLYFTSLKGRKEGGGQEQERETEREKERESMPSWSKIHISSLPSCLSFFPCDWHKTWTEFMGEWISFSSMFNAQSLVGQVKAAGTRKGLSLHL